MHEILQRGAANPGTESADLCGVFTGLVGLETCRYLKRRQLQDLITWGTISHHLSNFNKYIKDYFAKYWLDEIIAVVVEDWLVFMSEKGLKASSVNQVLRTFKLMTGEAARIKAVNENPCRDVKEMNLPGGKREKREDCCSNPGSL